MCKSKSVHEISEYSEDEGFLSVVDGGTKQWFTIVKVDGKPIEFRVDTGADVDVISEQVYQQFLRHKAVQPARKILKGADKKPLSVISFVKCVLTKGDKSVQTDLYVIAGASSLLGCASNMILGVVSMVAGTDCQDQYPELFTGLGEMPDDYSISLKETAEPFSIAYPRRISIPLMDKVRVELDRLEELGVIQPITEATDWCVPSVVVSKANSEKVRICDDFTKLNLAVKRECHLLLSVDHAIGQMAGAKVFSKLDANSGFRQIWLAQDSQLPTTFITPFGRHCYRRLPFGINSEREHYQLQIHKFLQTTPGVVCLIDDIVVYWCTEDDHDSRLDIVLKKLSSAGITLNKEKYSFKQSEISFLGHIICANNVRADPQ